MSVLHVVITVLGFSSGGSVPRGHHAGLFHKGLHDVGTLHVVCLGGNSRIEIPRLCTAPTITMLSPFSAHL